MKCRSLTKEDVNTRYWFNGNQTRWYVSLKGISFVSVTQWFPGNVETLSPIQFAALMMELQRKYHEITKRLEAYGKETAI